MRKTLDLAIIKGKVELEMAAVIEKREHAQEGGTFEARRKEIWKLYDRLKTANEILPNRYVFSKLPVVASLLNKPGKGAEEVATSLTEKAVLTLIQDNLAVWVETSRNDFAALLGYPNYRQISDKCITPTKRLTALFRCTRCTGKNMKGHRSIALTFREACAHKCRSPGMQSDLNPDWSVDNFELDQKVRANLNRYQLVANNFTFLGDLCDTAVLRDAEGVRRQQNVLGAVYDLSSGYVSFL